MGIGDIWWSWDSSRYTPNKLPQIVLTTTTDTNEGFSCQDPDEFLRVVKRHIEIKNSVEMYKKCT